MLMLLLPSLQSCDDNQRACRLQRRADIISSARRSANITVDIALPCDHCGVYLFKGTCCQNLKPTPLVPKCTLTIPIRPIEDVHMQFNLLHHLRTHVVVACDMRSRYITERLTVAPSAAFVKWMDRCPPNCRPDHIHVVPIGCCCGGLCTHHVYMSRAISTPISLAIPDFWYRLLPGGRPSLCGGRLPHPSIHYRRQRLKCFARVEDNMACECHCT